MQTPEPLKHRGLDVSNYIELNGNNLESGAFRPQHVNQSRRSAGGSAGQGRFL